MKVDPEKYFSSDTSKVKSESLPTLYSKDSTVPWRSAFWTSSANMVLVSFCHVVAIGKSRENQRQSFPETHSREPVASLPPYRLWQPWLTFRTILCKWMAYKNIFQVTVELESQLQALLSTNVKIFGKIVKMQEYRLVSELLTVENVKYVDIEALWYFWIWWAPQNGVLQN